MHDKSQKIEQFRVEEAWLLAQVIINMLDKSPTISKKDFIKYL